MAYKDGFKKVSAGRNKVVVKDIMAKVGDADFVVMPDIKARFKFKVPRKADIPYRLVFDYKVNEAGEKDKYLSFLFFENGMWLRDDINFPDVVSCVCSEQRNSFSKHRDEIFPAVLDGIGKLGFPVSASKDFDRISSFVTFLDRMPEVEAEYETSDVGRIMLNSRNWKVKDFYKSHPDFRDSVSSEMSFEERKMRYYDWGAHRDSENFVRERYQEKADYWRAKMEGRDVTPEMEARCGPGHKPDATDRFIRERHNMATVDYYSDEYDADEVLSYYEKEAREEWKTRKLVRALESKPVIAEKSQDFEMSY